jgi:hypothetical protein
LDQDSNDMKTNVLFLLVVLIAPQARAQGCASPEVRAAMTDVLSHAGDERPINVTFATKAEGVKIPAYLLPQYPDEMTIILQYEFDRLVVTNDGFEVGLWFNRRFARIVIPFAAIKAVYDNAARKCAAE